MWGPLRLANVIFPSKIGQVHDQSREEKSEALICLCRFSSEPTRRHVWFQINRKMVNTIWFRFDLIRFGKDFSVCVCIGCMLGIFGATSYARCGPVNENSLQFSRGFEFCSSRYMNPVSSSLVQEKWTSKTITNKMNRLMRNGRAKHKMCVP